jgi:diguanylate cyclase (GGDEF)-like protein
MTASKRRWWAVSHWGVWLLPARLLTAVLVIELLSVIVVAFGAAITPPSAYAAAAIVAGSLTAGGVLHAEVSMRVERVRRRIGLETVQFDLTSVWTFAAALMLPPLLGTIVVVVLEGFLYLRVWRGAKTPLYRQVFTTATIVLAVHAAAGVNASLGGGSLSFSGNAGLLPIVAAMLIYIVVNTCLVVGVVIISSDKSLRELLGHADGIILEIATLSLGALLALAVTAAGPWLVLLALPPMLVLHRAVLVRKLQEAVDTDSKTGLLTAAAWQKHAMQLVDRARTGARSVAVLILDLDHFKRVNDTHGHLAGDAVLSAVAGRLRAEVRDQDQVGRFGGEEFLILLPGGTASSYAHDELMRVAERIRSSVSGLSVEIPTADGPLTIEGLSVSIGGARFPEDGSDVPELVAVADSALYAAKDAGRNAVRIGPSERPQRRSDKATEMSAGEQDRRPPTTG